MGTLGNYVRSFTSGKGLGELDSHSGSIHGSDNIPTKVRNSETHLSKGIMKKEN